MDHLSRMSDVEGDSEVAVAMADDSSARGPPALRSPAPKTRSLSDGGTPKLSPSPHIVTTSRQSKDDIAIRDKERDPFSLPSTPIRTGFNRGLSLQMAQRDPASPAQQLSNARSTPLSPKLDHSHIYASPTNILPRRSRGLDFSRSATSLHHSTLAAQASPDSSPTIGSRAMNIPGRLATEYGTTEPTSSSLWGVMGNQERLHISSSVGSTSHAMSDMSSSSDDDDIMDEDLDEAYVTTPQVPRLSRPSNGPAPIAPWMPGSPAANSLLSFQQRQRQRKQPKKKARGPLGLGFHPPATPGIMSKSPPNNLVGANDMALHARRESISWAANQLHISGNDSDENLNRQMEGIGSPSRPSVVRRPVTRRGNLLPKTKGFARIRAALAEESAPVDAEFRREAEVVRQVRESDMDLEPRHPPAAHSAATTALSSPTLATQDSLDEMSEDMMMMDPAASALGLTGGNFKHQALKNSKGKGFWDTFSETSSPGAAPHLTREPSSVLGLEDISMGSPSASSNGGCCGGTASQPNNPFVIPSATRSSSGHGTPQHPAAPDGPSSAVTTTGTNNYNTIPSYTGSGPTPPTAADITRRIHSKRRRDGDDLDPISIKRRAVSPGNGAMAGNGNGNGSSSSVHGSPVMQSPLQRDMAPWGAPSVAVGGAGVAGAAGAVGYQGMVETNDGITRLSIE
ncbi:hypothetical protein BT67DRAFT_422849 [Trichocladium antarcticum]|uniref:Uncharacterized protein n=1 Tax=Trichocladium antarcticum TaxID=1450529 RepID=A0AAN6UIU1_9PEZI|nr:hypothetical protein BT67DRAFT_422849 [Trichocladium antarcticum]